MTWSCTAGPPRATCRPSSHPYLTILAGENHGVLRYFIVAVVLLALWLHWRAAFTADVRAALDDLPAGEERLDHPLPDLPGKRLAHPRQAGLAGPPARGAH